MKRSSIIFILIVLFFATLPCIIYMQSITSPYPYNQIFGFPIVIIGAILLLINHPFADIAYRHGIQLEVHDGITYPSTTALTIDYIVYASLFLILLVWYFMRKK